MKKTSVAFLALMGITLCFLFYSFTQKTATTGAPPAHTGAPGELTCAKSGCHDGNGVNSGTGILSISFGNNETEYEPNTTYPITVSISQAYIERFGFEVVVLENNQDLSVGTIQLTETSRTQTMAGPNQFVGREYITYKYAGTSPVANGLGMWTFDWTAPGESLGPVTFYVAAISADNDATDDGDETYATSLEIEPKTTTAIQDRDRSETFGGLEAYPNPSKGVFELRIDDEELINTELSIYNVLGEQIHKPIILSSNQLVDLSNQPKGVYFLKSDNGEKISINKVILK
ncbi:MAG: hypothetical protein COA57_07455 [Flavobacteriales bacterium]|nr:MAG: hypothetical protein COA57_07455 [Flavobacteriales bacterium]